MVKLAWDDDLAQVAQGWVDQVHFAHNPNRTAQYGALAGGSTYVGENLALYLTTSPSPPDIVGFALDAWFAEQQDYIYGRFQGSGSTGHYTQLVWADTHGVGCALAVCPGSAFGYSDAFTGYYLACDYAQGGNFIGYYPYEAGPTASQCPPVPGRGERALRDARARWDRDARQRRAPAHAAPTTPAADLLIRKVPRTPSERVEST